MFMKSKKTRRAGHLARLEEWEIHTDFQS
jgi:hypothetical protein